MQKITLGFSPCPNDTFIFDAMVNQPGFTNGLEFDYCMEDVETLNNWAFEGRLQVTKLSYNALLQLTNTYTLLDSGSALGRGVGPLVVHRADSKIKPADFASLTDFFNAAQIAIPGANTTANLLFTLAFPNAKNKTEVLFSEIENAVLDGQYDCGLVIHESRFTYHERGLAKLIDMGEWWEQTSGAAIPLGGICVRKDVPREQALLIEDAIRRSVLQSHDRYPVLSEFVTSNAQEMEKRVMRQHIDLYVNEYSTTLGEDGKRAIDTLFQKANEAGIISTMPKNLYL